MDENPVIDWPHYRETPSISSALKRDTRETTNYVGNIISSRYPPKKPEEMDLSIHSSTSRAKKDYSKSAGIAGIDENNKENLHGANDSDLVEVIQQEKIAEGNGGGAVKRKIPRPANAFMLFANEWRKKLANENPKESNKEISVRLGILWKNMAKDTKERYFAMARRVDAEHKRKYPDYVYNPKEARLRKAMREQRRESSRRSHLQNVAAPSFPLIDRFPDSPCFQTNAFQAAASRAKSAGGAYLAGRPPSGLTDWYKPPGESDSMQRSQVAIAMHHRTLEQQLGVPTPTVERAGAFSAAAYPASAFDESGYVVTEFADGQNWHHLYQNSGSSYPYGTSPQMTTQIGTVIHPSYNQLSAQLHAPHAQRAPPTWTQFPHATSLTHVPGTACNVAICGLRHAVFLGDRSPPDGQCAYADDVSRVPFLSGKHELDDVRQSYPTTQYQVPRQLESPVRCSTSDSNDDTSAATSGSSVDGLATLKAQEEAAALLNRKKERHSCCVQPLPGFHQAFGSTEIGKFARSEYFVNMVGESSVDGCKSEDMIPEASIIPVPPLFPFPTCHAILATQNAFHDIEDECYWFAKQSARTINRASTTVNYQSPGERSRHPEYMMREPYSLPSVETLLHRCAGMRACVLYEDEDALEERKTDHENCAEENNENVGESDIFER